MTALLLPIWRWLATHAAPWAAVFMAGMLYHAYLDQEAANKALQRQDRETAQHIADDANRAVERIRDVIAAEEKRRKDYAEFRNLLATIDVPAGGCAPDDAGRERMRNRIEAANAYALGAMPGGSGDTQSGE